MAHEMIKKAYILASIKLMYMLVIVKKWGVSQLSCYAVGQDPLSVLSRHLSKDSKISHLSPVLSPIHVPRVSSVSNIREVCFICPPKGIHVTAVF